MAKAAWVPVTLSSIMQTFPLDCVLRRAHSFSLLTRTNSGAIGMRLCHIRGYTQAVTLVLK